VEKKKKGAYKYISTQKMTKRKNVSSSLRLFVWKWYVNICDFMDSRVFFFLFWFVSFVVDIHCYTFNCKILIWFDWFDWQVCINFFIVVCYFFQYFDYSFFLNHFFSTIFFVLFCFLFIFQKRINEVRRESIS
jgi:hypothetical protein